MLVLVGAYPGRSSTGSSNLAGAGSPRRRARRRAALPAGRADDLQRRLRGRQLREVHEGADAARLRRRDRHVGGLYAPRGHRPLRVPDPHRAVDGRHDGDDFGERPDRALSRSRAAEPFGLCHRRLPPRQSALDRGRAEIFRPRRALLGHAALRRLAGLRLHRHGLLRGHRGGAAAAAAPAIGIILGIVFVAAGIAFKISAAPFHMWTPDVYEGAPTPVTAFFASAPKMAAMALIGARLRRRLPGHPRPVAADHRLHLDRFDGARRLRGDRPAQLQAADGLFLDRQCRLRADRACGRDAGRRPGRRRLHGDLSCHDARRLRLHPRDAPRRGRCSRTSTSSRGSPAPIP